MSRVRARWAGGRRGVVCGAGLFSLALHATCAPAPAALRRADARASDRVAAWQTWSADGRPHLRIALALPQAPGRTALPTGRKRILVTADLRGPVRHPGGVWRFDPPPARASGSGRADTTVSLAVSPGDWRLSVILLVDGEAVEEPWVGHFRVPAPAPDLLVLTEPQFRVVDAAGVAKLGVVPYVDHRDTRLELRSGVYDPQPADGAVRYTVTTAIVAGDSLRILDTREIPRQGVFTQLAIPLPIPEPGRHTVALQVAAGSRRAAAERGLDVGIADLAELGTGDAALELVRLLFGEDEAGALQHVPPDERAAAVEALWRRHDPDPSTPENELRYRVLERIRYADAHFGGADVPGWRTDRGRAWVRWGAPDAVDRLRTPDTSERLERWTWYGDNRVLVFVDRSGRGDWQLLRGNVAPF